MRCDDVVHNAAMWCGMRCDDVLCDVNCVVHEMTHP